MRTIEGFEAAFLYDQMMVYRSWTHHTQTITKLWNTYAPTFIKWRIKSSRLLFWRQLHVVAWGVHSLLFVGGNHASCQQRSPVLTVLTGCWTLATKSNTSTNYFLLCCLMAAAVEDRIRRSRSAIQLEQTHDDHYPITLVHHAPQPPSLPVVNSISFKLYKPSVVYIVFIICILLTFCPFSVPLCLPKLTNT